MAIHSIAVCMSYYAIEIPLYFSQPLYNLNELLSKSFLLATFQLRCCPLGKMYKEFEC